MITCPKCKEELFDSCRICGVCGTKLPEVKKVKEDLIERPHEFDDELKQKMKDEEDKAQVIIDLRKKQTQEYQDKQNARTTLAQRQQRAINQSTSAQVNPRNQFQFGKINVPNSITLSNEGGLHPYENYSNFLIRGEHGSGKTVLAENMMRYLQTKGKKAIIYNDIEMIKRYGTDNFYEQSEKLKFNNQKGILNIMTSSSGKVPKAIRSVKNNIVLFTSMSSDMVANIPPEFSSKGGIIRSFYRRYSLQLKRKTQPSNRVEKRIFLALTNSSSWIGEY